MVEIAGSVSTLPPLSPDVPTTTFVAASNTVRVSVIGRIISYPVFPRKLAALPITVSSNQRGSHVDHPALEN